MTRNILLVVMSAILTLAAAGVLVWTNFLEIPGLKSQAPSADSTPQVSPDKLMADNATSEGIGVSFADKDVGSWSVSEGHRIERFTLGDASGGFGRLSSTHPLNPEDRLSGLQAKLPAQWASKVNGKRIEVGLIARQPRTNAAGDISFLYATLQKGNSGWRTYKLSSEFQVYKFLFDVPLLAEGYQAQPLIIVRADKDGADRAVEIGGVYVKEVAR